jgi:hypothetical protein
MMPTFPRSPLSFRTAGFPQYGWKVCMSDGTFLGASHLSSLPAYATSTSSLSPSFVSADQLLNSSSESGNRGHTDTAKSGRGQPAPQGSSLRFGLFCPNPSSLNRPHPSHSQARSDFAAVRLIPSAFAVRERLGDPRVVPNFRLLLSTNMSLSMTPEVQGLLMSSSFTLDASLRVDLKRSASSSLPQSASRGARISGLPDSLPLRPARLFASLGGSDRVAPANRDFYFQAFDELVGLFIAGYRYGSNWTISADGTFTHKSSSVIRCTRSVREGLPHTALTSGSCDGQPLVGIRLVVRATIPVTRIPGSVSGTSVLVVRSPWSTSFPLRTPLPTLPRRLCSPASLVL